VLRKFVRVAPVLNLHVGGRIIGTTAEHPFFVEGKGWTPAFDLTIGDRVLLEDGQCLRVEGVADSGRVETVYNIEVEDDHTYFVGEQNWGWAVWSHNSSYPDEDILRLSNQGVQNAARNKNLFGSQIHHIATDKGASEGGISPMRPLGGHFGYFRRHICGGLPFRLWARCQYLFVRGLPGAAQ